MPIRNSALQTYNGSSVNVAWPSGTQAGDLVIFLAETAFNSTNPSGWTNLYIVTGTTANGIVSYKTLTSGDISTGFVTINASGSYFGIVCIVAWIGSPAVREGEGAQSAGVSPSVTTSSAPIAGDVGLYLSGGRNNATITPGRGTVLQTSTASEQTGCIYAETLSASGAVTVSFNTANTGSGVMGAIVIVEDAATVGAALQPIMQVIC